jgi:hypothetical protein
MTDASVARPIAWSWSAAVRGLTYAGPAFAVTMVDVPTGLCATLGAIPAAAMPLAARRSHRHAAAVVGVLAGVSMLTGAVLASGGVWVAVVGVFAYALLGALLAARHPAGRYVLALSVPLVGAGFSYGNDVRTAAGLAVAFALGATYCWLVSLPWPESAARAAPLPPPVPTRVMADYGVRLGLAGATCAAVGFAFELEHIGWAVIAALMVMRPDPDLQRSRSAGRAASVTVGALAAVAVVALEPSDVALAVVAGLARGGQTPTAGSRGYVSPAFTTFLVFLLLLYGNQDDASRRVAERVLETLFGIGVAYVFGILVPRLRRRSLR